jgi:hypothetical protein
MRRRLYFTVIFGLALLCLATSMCFSQKLVKCVLINKANDSVVPNALIEVIDLNKTLLAGPKGAFEFSAPAGTKKVTFVITAIGVKEKVEYALTSAAIEKVYVYVTATRLEDFTLHYLSPYTIMKKAVALIPQNNSNSNYFCFAHYRQYQKVNGRFQNLFEADPVIMFQIKEKEKHLDAEEAFAARHSRLSDFRRNNVCDETIAIGYLLEENPVYHLYHSSLFPGKFDNYSFEFDSAANDDEYKINYYSDVSIDIHGVSNYYSLDYHGESYEYGSVVVEKGSFAIKSLTRRSYRFPNFRYPKNNNYLLPDRKYTVVFVDGKLDVSYEKIEDKWFLKSINHTYHNEYYDAFSGKKSYDVNDMFELTMDSVSKYVEDEYVKRFYPKLVIEKKPFDKVFWDNDNFPFHFVPKDTVWNDLMLSGPVDGQFEKNGKLAMSKK